MDVRGHGGRLVALAVPLVLGACSDAGSTAPASFTEVNERVFQPGCVFTSCHQGASAAGNMSLGGEPHDRVVGVASMQDPDRVRIAPNEPDASYLIEKLTSDTPFFGTRMPPTAALDQERIDLVVSWIEAGAPND